MYTLHIGRTFRSSDIIICGVLLGVWFFVAVAVAADVGREAEPSQAKRAMLFMLSRAVVVVVLVVDDVAAAHAQNLMNQITAGWLAGVCASERTVAAHRSEHIF